MVTAQNHKEIERPVEQLHYILHFALYSNNLEILESMLVKMLQKHDSFHSKYTQSHLEDVVKVRG